MAVRVSELKEQVRGDGYADLEDRLLVLDFQAGNERDAYLEIYRRYSGLARHICQRILANAEDAEDATQESMLRVYQGLHRFNGRYAVQPWVARIATNVSLDIVRARSRRPKPTDQPLEEIEVLLEPVDPESAFERRLDQQQVAAILADLPEHHRMALVLREFEGRSHEEIGEELGVTAPQAKALIHRAKRSFRKAWSERQPKPHRTGLAVLAPILLAPFRLPAALRRLAHPLQEAASAAASSPAAATAGASAGERVAAAAVTVLVAGTAAVGAVTLGSATRERPAPDPTPVVRAAAPLTPLVSPAVRRAEREKPDRGREQGVPIPAPAVVSPTPTSTPSEAPPADPTAEPSPEPTPIAEAPAFSLGFAVEISSSGACDCSGGTLVSSSITGNAATGYSWAQVYEGAAVDAEGDEAWALHLEYFGSTAPDGRLDAAFTLTGPDGSFAYDAVGLLQGSVKGEDGQMVYRYGASYASTDDTTAEGLNMPTSGPMDVYVRVWGDGTLYSADFSLYST